MSQNCFLPKSRSVRTLTAKASSLTATIVLQLWTASFCAGLEIRVQPGDDPQPPVIAHSFGSELPLAFTVEIANQSGTSAMVALWQIGLTVTPLAGSVGTVQLAAIAVPEGSLLGEEQELFSYNELPSSSTTISAVDTSDGSPGKPLPIGGAAPIVELTFAPSSDASGGFLVSMATYDQEFLDSTSYWSTGGELVEFFPFENPIASDGSHHLAVIQIGAAYGDFNDDRIVDAADYTVWRDGLGEKYSDEDYELWRSTFGIDLNSATANAVPEPSTTSVIAVILFFSPIPTLSTFLRIRS